MNNLCTSIRGCGRAAVFATVFLALAAANGTAGSAPAAGRFALAWQRHWDTPFSTSMSADGQIIAVGFARPALAGQLVAESTNLSGANRLLCLTRAGTLRWEYRAAEAENLGTPCVSHEGGEVLLDFWRDPEHPSPGDAIPSSYHGGLICFEPSGRVRWRRETEGKAYGSPGEGTLGFPFAAAAGHALLVEWGWEGAKETPTLIELKNGAVRWRLEAIYDKAANRTWWPLPDGQQMHAFLQHAYLTTDPFGVVLAGDTITRLDRDGRRVWEQSGRFDPKATPVVTPDGFVAYRADRPASDSAPSAVERFERGGRVEAAVMPAAFSRSGEIRVVDRYGLLIWKLSLDVVEQTTEPYGVGLQADVPSSTLSRLAVASPPDELLIAYERENRIVLLSLKPKPDTGVARPGDPPLTETPLGVTRQELPLHIQPGRRNTQETPDDPLLCLSPAGDYAALLHAPEGTNGYRAVLEVAWRDGRTQRLTLPPARWRSFDHLEVHTSADGRFLLVHCGASLFAVGLRPN